MRPFVISPASLVLAASGVVPCRALEAQVRDTTRQARDSLRRDAARRPSGSSALGIRRRRPECRGRAGECRPGNRDVIPSAAPALRSVSDVRACPEEHQRREGGILIVPVEGLDWAIREGRQGSSSPPGHRVLSPQSVVISAESRRRGESPTPNTRVGVGRSPGSGALTRLRHDEATRGECGLRDPSEREADQRQERFVDT